MSRARLLLLGAVLLAGSVSIAPFARAIDDREAPSSVDPLAPPQVLVLHVEVPQEPVRPGGRARAALDLRIERGWHVNAHQPLEDFLIPTDAALAPGAPARLIDTTYPQPHEVKLSFSEEPMAVYEQSARIDLELEVPASAKDGALKVPGILTYQACNDAMCLPPADLPFELVLQVSKEGAERVGAAATNIPSSEGSSLSKGAASAAAGASKRAGAGTFDASRGMLVTFLLVFVGGLALNLTPCVYPMIPITVSIFGGQGGGPQQALKLAIFYVLGMALTYSALGTVAALTGNLLGAALQNPLVLAFIALVMVALALSMFGVYDFTMPQSLNRIAGGNRQGALGALFMGATVGIIAAPCIGPFVLGLLTYVGSTGNPALGFSLFFTLALGLGLPFLFLATASGSLSALPRSGSWMVWVKKVFGFVLLGMAVYFLTRSERLVPERFFLPVLALLSGIAALSLAVFDQTVSGRGFQVIKRIAGAVCILLAAGFLIAPRFFGAPAGIVWSEFNEQALAEAAGSGRPVIIDFSAAWCIPCKELDHWTFAAPPVVERSQSFVTLKADVTDSDSPAVHALRKRYEVLGVPTVVFLGPDGRELSELRFTGVIPPEEFLDRMDQALKAGIEGA